MEDFLIRLIAWPSHFPETTPSSRASSFKIDTVSTSGKTLNEIRRTSGSVKNSSWICFRFLVIVAQIPEQEVKKNLTTRIRPASPFSETPSPF